MVALLVREPTPAIALKPPDRLGHEAGEHIQEIVVGDGVVAVDAVHAGDHSRAWRAVQSVTQ